MEPDKIYNDISNLPPEARRQVADFISFLKTRYKKTQKTALRNNIINDPFIGIWKDREDMKDSSKWLRNVRESEWGGTS
ncbi:MAG: DUF2281 domain-containing protein [Desulfobacteraceae bacterium]|nr:DUF2281 domain-containing protein [Desulfobacteraceae bacterium]MBC2755753.1 DUF2281 domain-containing protein [Desulfobacteraceae bacterium]